MTVKYYTNDGTIGLPLIDVAGDTTQRAALGQIVVAADATYGQGEFEYVKFTGTVAAGDLVVIDRFAKTCVQSPAAAASAKGLSVGIAMGAQTANCYGWVMVRGIHDAANVATGTAAGSLLSGSATAGRGATAVANYNIDVATVKTLAASNLATVEMLWPAVNGR